MGFQSAQITSRINGRGLPPASEAWPRVPVYRGPPGFNGTGSNSNSISPVGDAPPN